MKEVLIVFVIALVIGSIMNSVKNLDMWGVSSSSADSAANKIPSVNEATFQQTVIQSSQPVLVDFYADNSDNSKAMIPVIADLCDQLTGTVKIVRMDANESPQISDKYSVTGVPDFVLFNKGEKVDHMVGLLSKDQMFSFLKKYVDIGKPPVGNGQNNAQPPANPNSLQG